ncbi:unnamed protein product [Triticum turgidum subsp. durum]|uniref:pyridoxal kinase n=1 Tax=Triticum turgidum subsp. durum TaxID=4567 RepID=A0A9R0WIT3_TRITD|nr:unnamed protein product [Triticum turgidum subsp. durum]
MLAAAAVPPLPPLPRSCASWRRWIPSTPFSSRDGPGWRRGTSGGAVHPAMARPPILSVALPSDTGRVLSIQSHTVQGYVGNKSAVFPLQLLGFDVDPINSVQFSNHTGYPKFRGQVLNGNQLWDLIEGLEENELLHYTHLLTGYIGSVSFLNTVLQVVDKLRSVNPDLIYVCDPVLGDEGKLYVPQDLVSVYQEKVVPVASMLTPNQFEVELLTGLRITSEQDGLKACNTLHSAGPRKVIITSALIEDKLLLIGSYKRTEPCSTSMYTGNTRGGGMGFSLAVDETTVEA